MGKEKRIDSLVAMWPFLGPSAVPTTSQGVYAVAEISLGEICGRVWLIDNQVPHPQNLCGT